MRKWLKDIRENLDLTQEKAAREAGISRPYYTRIENGDYQVPTRTAKKIAEALGFDWARFYSSEKDSA